MAQYGAPEPIHSKHSVDLFDCGSKPLDDWLKKHALQAHASRTSNVIVVPSTPLTNRVVGYHAIAVGQVEHENATERVLKGVGGYPVPVAILTRLAVDRDEQGKQLGKALVVDVIRRVLAAAEHVAIRALVIHAKDEQAKAFYMHLAEFEQSPTHPLHVMVLLKDLLKSIPP